MKNAKNSKIKLKKKPVAKGNFNDHYKPRKKA